MNVSGAAEHRGSEELIATLATEDRSKCELPIELTLELMNREPATKTDRAIRFEIEGPHRRLAQIFRKTSEGVRMRFCDMQTALEAVLQGRGQLIHGEIVRTNDLEALGRIDRLEIGQRKLCRLA